MMKKKIILISVSGNTGSDRKVNDLEFFLKKNNFEVNVYNIFEPYFVSNYYIRSFLCRIKKIPGGRFFALLLADFILYFHCKKNDKIGIICVTYPLIGIFQFINLLKKRYTYFYYIPDMMWMKKYVKNRYWKFFSFFAFMSINTCHFILAPTASAMIDLITFIDIKYHNKILRMSEYCNADYWQNINSSIPASDLLNKKFIFFPGVLKPSKNCINTILAFEKLHQNNKTIVLVLLLNKNKFVEFFKKNNIILSEEILSAIFFLDNISDSSMKWLYENCSLLSIVSIEEGVGLPILEGQLFNSNILTSISSAMPQTSGLKAFFADPFSIDSIYNGFLKILNRDLTNSAISFEELNEKSLLKDMSHIYNSI